MQSSHIKLIFVIILLLTTSCTQVQEEGGKIIRQKIKLQTEDNINIVADLYPEPTEKGIILVHMYGGDKNSWQFFTPKLRRAGYNVLAIDLRGHGGSDLTLSSMREKDYKNMVLDIQAAFDYFIDNGINDISVMGASLGANVALNFAVDEPGIRKVVLLSPGAEYRGIATGIAITNYKGPLLIIVGGLDKYSYDSSVNLYDKSPSKVKFQPYETSAHGTEILSEVSASLDLILNWLETN